jgi:hypothetical protein
MKRERERERDTHTNTNTQGEINPPPRTYNENERPSGPDVERNVVQIR